MQRRSLSGPDRSIDWLMAAILASLVVATRLPFRTSMLYNWDSANFALGTRYFDVRAHSPHPPGYFFYVAVASLLNRLIDETNASLVALSILFSAGAVVATYFLGKTMFGRRAGLVASLFLTFSVTFWTYGELALAYSSLALFSALAALFAWRTITAGAPKPGLALLLSIVYVLGSGFRPDLLLFLGPLWLWCLWLQGWKARLLCFLAAVAGFSLWYIPTALLSGGFAQYHAVLAAYTQSDVAARYSSAHRGLTGLIVNLRDTASYIFYALYAAALPLVGGGLWLLIRRELWLSRILLKRTAFFLVWVAPMLTFYTLIHIGDPGYVFAFLPAIMVLLGAFLGGHTRSRQAGMKDERPRFAWNRYLQDDFQASICQWRSIAGLLVTAAVVLANIGVFLLHPRPMTAQGLRQNDLDYREKIEYIETQIDPRSTILLSYDSYKHLLYYLPEYRQSLWVDVFANTEGHLRIPVGVKAILLVDARLNAINRSPQATQENKLPSGARLYLVAAAEGQVLTVGGKAIEVHR